MFAQHPDVYAKLYQPFQFDDDRLPSAPVFATQLVTAGEHPRKKAKLRRRVGGSVGGKEVGKTRLARLVNEQKIAVGPHFELQYSWLVSNSYMREDEMPIKLTLCEEGGRFVFRGPYTGLPDRRHSDKSLGPSDNPGGALTEVLVAVIPEGAPWPSRNAWELVYYVDPVTNVKTRLGNL